MANVQESFLKCLSKSLDQCASIDYSKQQGWFPEDGQYNLRFIGLSDPQEGDASKSRDGEPFYFIGTTFEIIDGPNAGKQFRDRPMYFRDSDANNDGATIDQERLCRLATVVSGEEQHDAAQAFMVARGQVGKVSLAASVKRKISPSNGKEYANLYLNSRL